MRAKRLLQHLLTPPWRVRQLFPPAARREIAAAVAASERMHRGELRLVVEGPLPLAALWRNQPTRARAAELFARLRLADTRERSGVLIYIQLVDRKVEVLADSGIAAKVPQAEWEALCRGMEAAFREGAYRQGALAALAGATRLLMVHFPAGPENPNELPDTPLLL